MMSDLAENAVYACSPTGNPYGSSQTHMRYIKQDIAAGIFEISILADRICGCVTLGQSIWEVAEMTLSPDHMGLAWSCLVLGENCGQV